MCGLVAGSDRDWTPPKPTVDAKREPSPDEYSVPQKEYERVWDLLKEVARSA